jgi:hypothetical protein
VLQEGTDYAFQPKFSWYDDAGAGTYCALATKRFLLLLPISTITDNNPFDRYYNENNFTIGGKTTEEAVINLLHNDALSLDDLEGFMEQIGNDLQGAQLFVFRYYRRIKINTGFLSKGLYLNKKEDGAGGWKGIHLKKDKIPVFDSLLKDLPNYLG